MRCHIDLRNLELSYDLDFFGPFLHPFLAAHAVHSQAGPASRPWPWTNARTVRGCLDAAWSMLGSWQARRGVLVDKAEFRRAAPAAIMALAAVLNQQRITCMADLLTLHPAAYAQVAQAIHEAVHAVSLIKKTVVAQPVFGSKVLHHYFPSLIPVFDTAKVSHGVLRLAAFVAFRQNGSHRRWLLWEDEKTARGPRMLEFHRYFGFCLAQLDAAGKSQVDSVRRRLGRAWRTFAPPAMAARPDSLLWRLDAKAAEFCLKGRAVAEGILP